jgi:hypothetical protein
MVCPIPTLQTIKSSFPDNPMYAAFLDAILQANHQSDQKLPSAAIKDMLPRLGPVRHMAKLNRTLLHKSVYHAVLPYVKQQNATGQGIGPIIKELKEGTGIGFR